MKKILMSAAALLLSAVGAYAAQQKYYFLYEEGHEDQPETSWFILDREAKKYIPDSCGDDELTVKNYKKSGNTETFDCYDNSYYTHSVVMKKNDKGQTVVQISYEKGKTNGRKIVCGTEAEYDKYWEEYRAKNGGDGGSTSTSSNPVDKATKKVKSGLKSGLNKLKKKNLDMIAANNLKQQGAGFAGDTNVLTLITEDWEKELALMSKDEAAKCLLDELLKIKKNKKIK